MTPISQISSHLFSSVEAFLREAGWAEVKVGRSAKFFSPPRDLGLDTKFAIAIPLRESVSVSSNLLYETVRVLQEIYGKPLNELLHEAEIPDSTSPWLLKARLLGDSIGSGTISLTKLDGYISQLTKSLFEVAKFKLGGEDKLQKLQARNFVEKCQFMPTEAGSFITAIEIPHEEIRPSDLISPSLTSQEIASNWFSAVDFLNTSVLRGSEDYFMSDSAVGDAIRFLNVPLAESLSKLIGGTAVSQFEFELKTQTGRRSSSTGNLDQNAHQRLDGFVKFFRDSLINESNLSVEGKIFELRSRDPEGNRNHVAIRANIFGDLVVLSMTLNNQDYQTAIQAHRQGRSVRIVGDAVRLKTQTRITRLDSFLLV